MGNKTELKLDMRELHGKKVAKLRKDGIVPGVVYGASTEPITVQVHANVFEKVYRQAGKHAPIHLLINGKKKIAMIKEVDVEPTKGKPRHIAFHAVKASDPVVAEIPVHLVGEGESDAEKAGLIVLQALEKVEVKALPMDLPDAIEVSILDLKEAGDKVTLADVQLPVGVEYVEHGDGHEDDNEEAEKPKFVDQMVASVWEPAALAAANDTEDEPEVEAEAETAEEQVSESKLD